MARTIDLGWPMARCDGEDLEIFEPESEDTDARSFRISGYDNLRELRDFLSDCLADAEMRRDLESKTVEEGVDNSGMGM